MANYLLYILLVCFFIARIQSNDCNFNPSHLVKHGHELKGLAFWESRTKGIVECAQSCVRRKKCKSFNFNENNRLCQLYQNIGAPSTAGSELVYSEIGDWPSQVDTHCYSNSCGDDEICIPGNSNGAQNCAHSCFNLVRTCPLPVGSSSDQPRTVGSIFSHTCAGGLGGQYIAVCLENGQWNETIENVCQLPTTTSTTTTTTTGPSATAPPPPPPSTTTPTQVPTTISTTTTGPPATPPPPPPQSTTSTTSTTTPSQDWFCRPNYNECYLIDNVPRTYNDSKIFCENRNSSIVQSETQEKNEFLKAELRSATQGTDVCPTSGFCCFWNALYQYAGNGDETWTPNGPALTYKDWGGGEPNADSSDVRERCTCYFRGNNYTWADVECEKTFLTLCEK